MIKLFMTFCIVTVMMSAQVQAEEYTKSPAYERVMTSGTLRCGYINRPPAFQKDPVTGVISGIFKDYTESIATSLNLKVDWTEEVGWGEIVTALENGRIDAFCAGLWANSSRVSRMDFVQPIMYEPIYAYARADDTRFDKDSEAANKPEIKIAVTDGTTYAVIAGKDFPLAEQLSLPQLSPNSDLFMNLVTKKVDLTLCEPSSAEDFLKNSPDSIKQLQWKQPLRAFGVSIGVAGGEYRLKRMLDLATEEFLQTGEAEKTLGRYEKVKGGILRVEVPYKLPH